MRWVLRKVDRHWEIWSDEEKMEERSLAYLSRNLSPPSQFSSLVELEQWLDNETKKRAKDYILFLLAGQSYSSHSLRRKLIQKGYPESAINELIDWILQLGLVQDVEYLRSMIQRESENGHGPTMIIWKLRSKGFSEEEIKPLISEIITPQHEQESIRKLLPKLQDKSKPQRFAALLRRGFSMSAIIKTTNERPEPDDEASIQ